MNKCMYIASRLPFYVLKWNDVMIWSFRYKTPVSGPSQLLFSKILLHPGQQGSKDLLNSPFIIPIQKIIQSTDNTNKKQTNKK